MYSTVMSGQMTGMIGTMVQVEVDMSTGLPGFDMVGELGNEVKEAKERVKIALKNIGMIMPAMKVTVNLSPANLRKRGTGFDLPIAIGILQSMGKLEELGIEEDFLKQIFRQPPCFTAEEQKIPVPVFCFMVSPWGLCGRKVCPDPRML